MLFKGLLMPSTLFMDKGYNKKRSLDQIARDCFNYLGCHLPQHCANDEFYFLPRSGAAIQHLNTLDDLSPEKIQDHLGYVKGLLSEYGVDANVEYEDYLLGLKSLKKIW